MSLLISSFHPLILNFVKQFVANLIKC
jgi:hypothetical protein